MWRKALGRLPLYGGRRSVRDISGADSTRSLAIIRDMKESPLSPSGATDPEPARTVDPRLEHAHRALGELEEASGAEALAPAKQLAELLEDLLEGGEGEAT